MNDIYENLKNSEGFVEKNQLLLFLLCLINIYEYYLLKVNKSKFNVAEIAGELKKESIGPKAKSKSQEKISTTSITPDDQKREVNAYILNRINKEITSRIKVTKKYGGLDENGELYIPIEMAKSINKDFNLLCVNWSNHNQIHNKHKPSHHHSNSLSFKPAINNNSKKLSINFRQKIQSVINM